MNDLEMTKLCAEAMGLQNPRIQETLSGDKFVTYGPLDQALIPRYWPLQYDAQCFALVKEFHLEIIPITMMDGSFKEWSAWKDRMTRAVWSESPNLNRCIVECIAKLKNGEI